MYTIMQSEIFFFISSIGFVIIFLVFLVILIYVLRAVRAFTKIMETMEKSINILSDETRKLFEEMLEEMRDSSWFRFFFGKKKNNKRRK